MYKYLLSAFCCATIGCGIATDCHAADAVRTAKTVTAPKAIDINAIAQTFEYDFHRILQREKLPGGAFAIVNPHEVIKLGTAGYRAAGKNDLITADTVFRLASVSKTFAAVLTGKLVEEGKLTWNDRVTNYEPRFTYRDAQRITLQDIIGQTTGIVGHAWDRLIEENWLPETILPKFAELSPVCRPGSCYTYQNVAFSLVEPAINQVTSSDYASSLQEHLFEPLGMEQASVGLSALQLTDNVAQPHRKVNGQWREVEVLPTYYRISPAAGVNASIIDLGRWLQAQMGANPNVISKQLVDTVSEPRIVTPQALKRRFWRDYLTAAHYGLGWRVYQWGDETLVAHGGFVMGYRSEIAYSPKHNIGFALLLHSEGSSASELTTRFWKDVFTQSSTD